MISIITCTKRENFIDNVFENYQRQEWQDKELIIILNNDAMNLRKWQMKAEPHENISVYQLSDSISLGNCLNFGIEQSKYDYIAKFDDDDYYAPKYLTQAMSDLRAKGASVVGKISAYMYFEDKNLLTVHMPGNESKYLPDNLNLKGATLVFKKDVYQKVKFIDKNCDEDDFFTRDCRKQGIKVYVTDKNHFVYIRRDDPEHHTWKQPFNDLLKYCSEVRSVIDYKPLVSPTNDEE
jgi:glycosyltransferase involved in cell wall biosynthesis